LTGALFPNTIVVPEQRLGFIEKNMAGVKFTPHPSTSMFPTPQSHTSGNSEMGFLSDVFDLRWTPRRSGERGGWAARVRLLSCPHRQDVRGAVRACPLNPQPLNAARTGLSHQQRGSTSRAATRHAPAELGPETLSTIQVSVLKLSQTPPQTGLCRHQRVPRALQRPCCARSFTPENPITLLNHS
jgi:hypothetical protein